MDEKGWKANKKPGEKNFRCCTKSDVETGLDAMLRDVTCTLPKEYYSYPSTLPSR